MSDSTKPAKSKSTKLKAPRSHPKYSEMVASAIKSLNQKGSSSKAAIMKYIAANYKVGNNTPRINCNVKLTLKQGVLKRTLAQTKGVGASGSFKLRKTEVKGDKKEKVKRPAKVSKKPAKKNKSVKPKKASSKSAKSSKSRIVKPKKAGAKKQVKKTKM
ncbi:histone H1-delta-like [Octopus sinensis]|uniref:Histone H1-delta-like n=1 Tax=Octopus sinensis TaxID=2607531 RepID=A0A6P7S9W5_9MOLL|nr:histone H1-delta-like [Octopus sinensis]